MIYVIYHKDCLDGIGAAFSAWYRLCLFEKKEVKFISSHYNEPIPDYFSKEDDVYLVDFSWSRNVVEDIKVKVNKLLIIDHHQSAEKDLKDLDCCIFDMSHSGAILAWKYFNPDVPAPKILYIVEDYDLWKWEFLETKAFISALKNDKNRNSFDYWLLLVTSEAHFNELLYKGDLIVEDINNKIDSFIKKKRFATKLYNKDQKIVLYDTNLLINEYAEALYTRYNIAFTISFFFLEDGSIIFSLRSSKKSNVDVSLIAKEFGGGGHFNASGMKVNFPESIKVLESFYELPNFSLE